MAGGAGGFIGGFNPLDQDPIEYSGKWGLKEQVQAIAARRWTGITYSNLYAWGYVQYDGDAFRSTPVQFGQNSWAKVDSNGSVAAVQTNGTLWTWGTNGNGQLGQNDTITRSSPVQVGSLTTWSDPAVGSNFAHALKTDGTLWALGGRNNNAQLGIGSTTYQSSPIQVGASTNWIQLSAGSTNAVAVNSLGELYSWGAGAFGANGDGSSANNYTPGQIGALTNWSQASSGGLFGFAVKTDGTLWGWGLNAHGQLGNGVDSGYGGNYSPIQVGSLTTWSKVTAGSASTIAIKTDGTLWAWGRNNGGQLGQNDTVSRSSPVQIGSSTDWLQVSERSATAIALKTGGSLWGWGYNSNGQVGDGTKTNRSNPVQIGTSTGWVAAVNGEAQRSLGIIQGTTN